jgi:thiosulfate/3-mercaptopyruvate sulfurtransferase
MSSMSVILMMGVAGFLGDGLVTTGQVALESDALTVVDVRDADAYAEGHVPGAVSIPSGSLSVSGGEVYGMLKPTPEVGAIFARAGLQKDNRIVVYGDADTPANLTAAARVLWALALVGYDGAAIMDGGIQKWVAEERPLSADAMTPAPTHLPGEPAAEADEKLVATLAEVEAVVAGTDDGVLVDARPRAFFLGDKKKDYVAAAGRLPGAVSVPMGAYVFGPYNTMKTPDQVRREFETAGVTGGSRIVAYCNSGRASALAWFAARYAGFEQVELYDGSMAQWTHTEGDYPVRTGE